MMNIDSVSSPKTPGGISKTLLTPIRRIGLSRNWKRNSKSPFISPLPNLTNENDSEIKLNKVEKLGNEISTDDVGTLKTNKKSESLSKSDTPSRRALLVKRKSKALILSTDSGVEYDDNIDKRFKIDSEHLSTNSNVSKLSRSNSKCVNVEKGFLSKISDSTQETNTDLIDSNCIQNLCKEKVLLNNLTKECIVVIQKKMKSDKCVSKHILQQKPTSQTDSNFDEMPLSKINCPKNIDDDDDNDFIETKTKIQKLHKNTSTSGLSLKTKIKKPKDLCNYKTQLHNNFTSQTSNSDDDNDFECNQKRNSLFKMSNKTSKLQKANSTGSITQKDIDDMKARIEIKKKLLIAKSMTEDTNELRCLIKKWQKGCQEALIELFDLMRKKFPDKQNMDYSEILHSLKIPLDLVGYDEENDCFVTPDDSSLILSNINI